MNKPLQRKSDAEWLQKQWIQDGPEQPLTWGVLGGCKRGHGIGKVEVSSDAQLALHCWGIRRGGRQERFFTGFLIDSRQIRVNQGIKELHYELSIVRDLCLLCMVGEEERAWFFSLEILWSTSFPEHQCALYRNLQGMYSSYLREGASKPPQPIKSKTYNNKSNITTNTQLSTDRKQRETMEFPSLTGLNLNSSFTPAPCLYSFKLLSRHNTEFQLLLTHTAGVGLWILSAQ